MKENVDVVVIGGGSAGLSGAIALARFRRTVVLIDGGDPRNAPAGHIHNFLTRDGTPPSELYAIATRELESYGGRIVRCEAQTIERDGADFRISTGADTFVARGLLVATGACDELPDVPGLAQQWGNGVVHCPYCHGWEIRDQRIGILAATPTAMHQALMFRQLSADVTYLMHSGEAPSGEAADQLAALGIPVIAGPVAEIESTNGVLTGVHMADGHRIALDAVAVASFVRARADVLKPLGLEPVQVLMGDHAVATRIPADQFGATSVPRLYVAGNVTDPMAQVVSSAAAGLMAASGLNRDLISADAAAAAQRHRDHFWSEQAWDERYRERGQRFSGNPNAALVTEVSGLRTGSALDAGAGEGGDAIWLAQQGWDVTAADLSVVALERLQGAAAAAGVAVDAIHLDLTQDDPPATYDLVTSSYVHVPGDLRRVLFARLAEAVAPRGTLVVIGHDPADLSASAERRHLAEAGWSAEYIAGILGDGWVIDTCESRPRLLVDGEGHEHVDQDAVLRAHRIS
jgi:thioredoxin reductase/2-polyprenyl-3-methyl-5-hydroxy-6-metoxy-1,4-benzoquinol methylase